MGVRGTSPWGMIILAHLDQRPGRDLDKEGTSVSGPNLDVLCAETFSSRQGVAPSDPRCEGSMSMCDSSHEGNLSISRNMLSHSRKSPSGYDRSSLGP